MIIAFAGQKGGSGKTTTAIALACYWHAKHRNVLLVDADPQGSVRTWSDVAAEAGHKGPTVVTMTAGMHRPEHLPRLAATFDHTVIDCPPRHGEIQRAALVCSDVVVLPCGPGAVDAWALGESVDLVQEVRALRPSLRAFVLITRRTRTAIGAGARAALADSGLPVLATELGQRVTYQEAPAAGQGVTAYAPQSVAAAEIRALATELQNIAKRKGSDYAP